MVSLYESNDMNEIPHTCNLNINFDFIDRFSQLCNHTILRLVYADVVWYFCTFPSFHQWPIVRVDKIIKLRRMVNIVNYFTPQDYNDHWNSQNVMDYFDFKEN